MASMANRRMSLHERAALADEAAAEAAEEARKGAANRRMRAVVDVFDLEMSYGIEPRFASHLILECKKYLHSEIDIREQRAHDDRTGQILHKEHKTNEISCR